jgi:hypothetical protein
MANYVGNFGFSIVDELNVRASATLPVTFADTVTLAQLATAWNTMEALLQAIVDGSVERGGVNFGFTVSSPAAAGAGSRVEQNGIFNFLVGTTGKRFGIATPSLADAVISGGLIDLGSPVSDFTDAITASITGGGSYTTPEGVDLGALVDAFISFRKHRRQLRATTIEEA